MIGGKGNTSVSIPQKAWEPPLIWLVWKILKTSTVYRWLKSYTLKSKFIPDFQNRELWYMFSLCFQPRVFNLAIKSHGSRVSTFSFKAPTIESIIVILSVMCIVPKYHIVFCMIVILLILKYLFLVSFETPKVLLHLCFASLMGASEIPLYYV